MPIRIMHVVDSLGRGGMENGLLNIIERLNRGRFEHVIYSIRDLDPNAARFEMDHVRIASPGKPGTGRRFQMPDLTQAIRRWNPDVVHSRNWGAIEAVVAGRWAGSCAVVHSEHGLDRAGAVREPWRRRCFRRMAFGLAHRVISVSNQLRDLHAARTGFAAQKISVIRNGVDCQRFSPNAEVRRRVRAEFGLSECDFCIGAVGNLTPVKDYSTLLGAMELVARSCTNWRLLIVGEGPERPQMEAFIASHPDWRNRVSLVGLSSRVPDLLNAVDLYVLSSVTEGMSNSVLEAMATALPVVVTATGGNPETVVDGQSGLLFPVGAIERLAGHVLMLERHKALRAQLGREALRRVREEFSINTMIDKYDELYRSVAGMRTQPASALAGA